MSDSLSQIGNDPDALRRLAERWGLARFIFYPQTDSTQNIVRAMNDSGMEGWTLVAADYQTAGRGQHGRTWTAQPGTSLMFSLLLRPGSIESAMLLPIRAGLAIAAALDGELGAGARTMLKWPNDLMLNGGKSGGILCESQIRGEEISVIVGVGLNVRRFPLELGDRRDIAPAFLQEESGHPLDRLDLLAAIIRSFQERLHEGKDRLSDAEMRDYAGRDWLHGRSLKSPQPGRADGINREGHLQILRPDGSVQSCMAGRVIVGEDEGSE